MNVIYKGYLFRFLGLSLIILCTLSSCKREKKIDALHESLCIKFKHGTFYNKEKTYKIVRQQNKQVEFDLKTGAEYHFEVHWLYGCAYNLIYKFSINPIASFNLKERDKLKIQFIEIVENGQGVKSEVEFGQKLYYQTFYKFDD